MNERTALITGASRGMGRGLAERLAARGTTVVLCSNTPELLDEVRSGIVARGGRAIAMPVDITQPSRVLEVVREAEALLGGLDLVVANAGIGTPVDGKSMTWERIAPVLQTNVMGTIATVTAALPAMVERGRGHLVAVSSIAGRRGLPTVAHYCASKAAISRFLEGLRIDLAGTGVAITDVQPGFVDSAQVGRKERYPTPFLLGLDQAVTYILEAIDRRAPVAAFPPSLAVMANLWQQLPGFVHDRLMVRIGRRARMAAGGHAR
jgi:short-subunit dehydrogenase